MLLSKKAESITPYTAGEQPQDKTYIKLNTNENPYAPSPQSAEALAAVSAESLRLYPDPESMRLRTAIAKKEGTTVANVFVGNGSDEVLALCFAAFLAERPLPVWFADVTYSFYPVFASLYNVPVRIVPLGADYRIQTDDYLYPQEKGGIILCNPNAPTATALSLDAIEQVVRAHADVPILIDEAYIDFADHAVSAVPLCSRYDNVVVVKTFSKSYALAGMRCGYAIGSTAMMDGLRRMKDSFNSYPIDRVCEAVCSASIADTAYFSDSISRLKRTRRVAEEGLRAIGFGVDRSETNFLFVTVPNGDADSVYRYLKQNGILVRYFAKPRLYDKLRITVGTDAEMDELVRVLARYRA